MMVRPLGRESDKAFALLSSLSEGQRKQAFALVLGEVLQPLAGYLAEHRLE